MTGGPVQMLGLPYGRMICKTCGKRFLLARDLVAHIIEARQAMPLARLPEDQPQVTP